MAPNPNSIAARIMSDPSASCWLKDAIRAMLDRNPVDALNDAEVLRVAVKDHLAMIQEAH